MRRVRMPMSRTIDSRSVASASLEGSWAIDTPERPIPAWSEAGHRWPMQWISRRSTLTSFQRPEVLVCPAAERDRIGWRADLKHWIVRRPGDAVWHAHDWVEGVGVAGRSRLKACDRKSTELDLLAAILRPA